MIYVPKLTPYHTRLRTLGDKGLEPGSYYEVILLSHLNISLWTMRSTYTASITSISSSPHPVHY